MAGRYCPTCGVIHLAHERCPGRAKSGWARHKRRSGYVRGVPRSVRTAVLRRCGSRCARCGIAAGNGVRLEMDHIVPRSLGGGDEAENLQPLCAGPNSRRCHRRKTEAEAKAARRRKRR